MKLKRTIVLTCCVIIASLGIALTGCSNSSSDKAAESTSEVVAESTSEVVAENTSEVVSESTSEVVSESTYMGTWVATVAEYEGTEYSFEETDEIVEFTFRADGTGTFIGDGMNIDIEWAPVEGGLKYTDSAGSSDLTYKDGRLLWELEIETGLATMYLEKQQ
ncbi:MAG: hypothetical protein MR410_04060 [Eubacterium sp.]|nr:hypothetical protein [Eubacterium sp.]